MSKGRKRTQDLTLLSAYLDHALREPEQKRLETRLAHEPDLRERLENLRRTKQMIGFLPRLKAPRNFTLTPEMVAVQKTRQPLFVTLRYATAIAAILLVVLLGAEWITGLPRASMVEAPVAMEESLTDDTNDAPEPLILWGAPKAAGDSGGIGGGAGGDTGEAESFIAEVPVPEIGPDTPVEGERSLEEAPAEAMPILESTPQAADGSTEIIQGTDTAQDNDLILGLNPEEGGQIIEKSADAETTPSNPFLEIHLLRWVEIGLLVIVLGSVITLLILRKRAR